MVLLIMHWDFVFLLAWGVEELKTLAELQHAKFGSNITFDELVYIGRDILKNEHEFNLAAGICPASNLPEFFELEKLPPFQTCFDVDYNVVKPACHKKLFIMKPD
jgi:hypothetical protein